MYELGSQVMMAYSLLDLFCMFTVISVFCVAVETRKRAGRRVSPLTVTTIVIFTVHILMDLIRMGCVFYTASEELMYFVGGCYYVTAVAAACAWLLRVCRSMRYENLSKSLPTALLTVPAIGVILINLTDRWHGLFFTITAENTFERGPLHMIMLLVIFGYILASGILAVIRLKNKEFRVCWRVIRMFFRWCGFCAAKSDARYRYGQT